MDRTYDIFERLPDGKLLRVETVEGLELAKMRFSFLTFSSQREYLVYDQRRGCEVVLRAAANAG
jgi:hypothetical protein